VIPEPHREALSRQMNAHTQRVAFLLDQIEQMSREARVHALVLQLAQDERILAVMGEVVADPEAAALAARDAGAYVRDKGLELPPELNPLVRVDDGGVTTLATYDDGRYAFELQYDPESGFRAHPLEGRGLPS
jgi:hypothetical protein